MVTYSGDTLFGFPIIWVDKPPREIAKLRNRDILLVNQLSQREAEKLKRKWREMYGIERNQDE